MTIKKMGHFTAIGMRQKVDSPGTLVINTCGGNDTDQKGSLERWDWSNPTNRKFKAVCVADPAIVAVSIECLWQGTKILTEGGVPNQQTLGGKWRNGKAKRPIGAWNGSGDLITNPGDARRAIYIPAFKNQIENWLKDEEVADWVQQARDWPEDVYLRDHDTGRGIDRRGPMSHAWVLAVWLNTGEWPC